jgi:hypothetical protein
MMMKDYRDNLRVMVDDLPAAEIMMQRGQSCMPLTYMGWFYVGMNERFRYYKNLPGHFFAKHYDGSFPRNENERSMFTVLVNLSSDYTGGETAFYDDRLEGS